MRFLILFLLFNLTITISYAQKDSLFIKDLHDRLIVKLSLGGPSHTINFTPRYSPDSARSSYSPNTYGIIGLDLAYKSFSISLSTRAGDLDDTDLYGKTKYTSFSARFSLKKLTLEGFYKNYTGYADLYTPRYLKVSPDSSPYLVRNDLQNKYYKLKVMYQFSDKKFSYAAAFSFTERQKKSAVALLMMGNINRFLMNADSSFFPAPVRFHYDSLQSMKNLKISSLGGAMGGAFNLVWKKFFFSGIVFLGFEFQHQKYFLAQPNEWKTNFTTAPVVDTRFSLGFNGNRAFVALTAKSDINTLNLPSFSGKTTFSMVTLDFGYRFKAPKILVKTYSGVQRLIHKVI